MAQLGRAARVVPVDDAIARVLEERERGVLREVVDVADRAAHPEELPRTQQRERRQVERNVEDLVRGPGAQLPQEAEAVLDVLEDIDRERDVEARVLLQQVGEL